MQVYIKDTSSKVHENIVTPTSLIVNLSNTKQPEAQPQQYYAVRVSTTNEKGVVQPKQEVPKQAVTYNVPAMNLANIKTQFHQKSDALNEIINIEPDTLNSIISNSSNNNHINRRSRMTKTVNKMVEKEIMTASENNLIHIDLTQPEAASTTSVSAYEGLPPIKTEKLKNTNIQEAKYMYTFKIEDANTKNPAAFVLNQIGNVAFENSLINVPQNNNNNNHMKIVEAETKTTSTINTSVFNNLNLVPSNINLNSTNLNLVNLASGTNNSMVSHNLSSAGLIQGSQNANTMHLMGQTNQEIAPPYPSNDLNQNANFDSKNVLANLAVISRISNLSRTKNRIANNNNNPNGGSDLLQIVDQNPMPCPLKQHVCDVCQKVFKRREHLYQHVKLHTGFRPFVCEHCNKSFMRKEHLLRHMISHSGQKNHTCNICEKSFSRNDNLLKHKKTHDKQQSYTCEICQKQFVMKHYYLAHKMAHEDEKVNFGQNWNNILKV